MSGTSPASRSALERNGATGLDAVADRTVVLFANDWHTDPTSKHHVGRALSEVTTVYWVESSGMRTPNLADASDLRRIWSKVTGRGRRTPARDHEPPPVEVVSPISIPLPGFGPAEWVNGHIYRREVARARRRNGDGDLPLLWVYVPTTAPYLDRIPHDGLIYHCVDRWWEFSEYDPDVMRANHAELCRRADVVFASAAGLVDDCRDFTDDVHLVRHGVDWEHFSRAALEALEPPPELASVEGPVVGFFGLVHDWIDLDLLGAVADAHPEATLVLIGDARVDVSALAARPNVRMPGRKPYAELPAWAARFDVALVPFVVNELTTAVNPIKLREYLSAGVPVVSTALPEILVYEESPAVRIAPDRDAFVAAVGDVLSHPPDRASRKALAESMAGESWAGRTSRMVELWTESRG